MEFRASKQFTGLLDTNYATGFEDFHMDTIECFLEVDFSSIKLNFSAASSLLQTSSEDVNIEDDASTQSTQDEPKTRDNPHIKNVNFTVLVSHLFFYEVRCFVPFEFIQVHFTHL